MKNLNESIQWLIGHCRQQIADYENPYYPNQCRSGLRTPLWNHRIIQIEHGKVIDGETRDWLRCIAIFWNNKNREFSDWIMALADTYKGTTWSLEGRFYEQK